MKTTRMMLTIGTVFSSVLAFGSRSLAGTRTVGRTEKNVKITVSISNHAQIRYGALAGAVEEAARIFRQAGVETVWLNCGPSSTTSLNGPALRQQLSPTVLFVRILPGSMTEGFGLRHNTCGVAAPSPNGGFGSYAFVFFDCVQEQANSLGARAETILSHMLAHEMGHLLLGPGSHSHKGIMHADWDREQVQNAGRGRLRFTASQGQRLREQVLARARADQAGPHR